MQPENLSASQTTAAETMRRTVVSRKIVEAEAAFEVCQEKNTFWGFYIIPKKTIAIKTIP